MDSKEIKALVRFQFERKIISQAKDFLNILEDLPQDVPDFELKRKRILDKANDHIRELNQLMNDIDGNWN